jgi:BNR/Asp-box repeat
MNITPPTTSAASISDAFFLNESEGWVVGLAEEEPVTPLPARIFITKDGGATWAQSVLPEETSGFGGGAPISVDFVDSLNGWVMIKKETSSNFSVGDLYRTADGGLTWNEVTVPIGDPINFVTPTFGWTAGGPRGDELYVTNDGASTWSRVKVDVPLAFATSTIGYGVPTFFTETQGVLPVTFSGILANSGFAFYYTFDGGLTWRLPTQPIPSISANTFGARMPADPVTPDFWIQTDPQGRRIVAAADVGHAVDKLIPDGLPSGIFVFDFADSDNGWAGSASTHCPGKTNCTYESLLRTTSDGGRTWSVVTVP